MERPALLQLVSDEMSTIFVEVPGPPPEALQTELLSGESLLWWGQPLTRVVFHPSDWYMTPFSLLWGGFAIFWEFGASGDFNAATQHRNGAAGIFPLFGIPFVLMGQYFIWGRFVYAAWKKKRMFYGVTNKRVLVVHAAGTRKVLDGQLGSLTSIGLTTRTDGVGSLDLAPDTGTSLPFGGRRNQSPKDADLSRLAFLDIAGARAVYQLIQRERERLQERL